MPRAPQPLTLVEAADRAFCEDHYAEAIDLARRAIGFNDEDVNAHRILGQSLVASSGTILAQHPGSEIHRRQLAKGMEKLQDTCARFPRDAMAPYALGVAHSMVAQWNEAANCFNRAIENDPADSVFYQAIISALCSGGRLTDAAVFVDTEDPLSPSGEDYAEQLRSVVAR